MKAESWASEWARRIVNRRNWWLEKLHLLKTVKSLRLNSEQRLRPQLTPLLKVSALNCALITPAINDGPVWEKYGHLCFESGFERLWERLWAALSGCESKINYAIFPLFDMRASGSRDRRERKDFLFVLYVVFDRRGDPSGQKMTVLDFAIVWGMFAFSTLFKLCSQIPGVLAANHIEYNSNNICEAMLNACACLCFCARVGVCGHGRWPWCEIRASSRSERSQSGLRRRLGERGLDR